MAVILQPCGNKDARAHYNDTVMFPVPHDSVSNFLNETDNDALKDIYPDGILKIWDVTPINQRKWAKVEAGDIALFYKTYIETNSITWNNLVKNF